MKSAQNLVMKKKRIVREPWEVSPPLAYNCIRNARDRIRVRVRGAGTGGESAMPVQPRLEIDYMTIAGLKPVT